MRVKDQVIEVIEALEEADKSLDHLYKAEELLKDAKGWGIADIIGGGLFVIGLGIMFILLTIALAKLVVKIVSGIIKKIASKHSQRKMRKMTVTGTVCERNKSWQD